MTPDPRSITQLTFRFTDLGTGVPSYSLIETLELPSHALRIASGCIGTPRKVARRCSPFQQDRHPHDRVVW